MGELQEALEELSEVLDNEMMKTGQLYHDEKFVEFIKSLTIILQLYILDRRKA